MTGPSFSYRRALRRLHYVACVAPGGRFLSLSLFALSLSSPLQCEQL